MSRLNESEQMNIKQLNQKFDALVRQGVLVEDRYGLSMTGPIPSLTPIARHSK